MKWHLFLRFAFFKSDIFLLLVLIARIVLKRNPYSRVDQEIRGKILQSCFKVYKVDWLSSYLHACHDEITYFNKSIFSIRFP